MINRSERRLIKTEEALADKFIRFSPFFEKMRFEMDESIETAGISADLVLFYNPDFIESLDNESLKTLLMHEIMHVMSEHHRREIENPNRLKGNHNLHNIAMDIEINCRLENYNMKPMEGWCNFNNIRLPDGTLIDLQPYKTYEWYFKELYRHYMNFFKNGPIVSIADVDSDVIEGDSENGGYTLDTDTLISRLKEEGIKRAGKSCGDKSDDPNFKVREVKTKKYPWNMIFRNVISKNLGPFVSGFGFKSYRHLNKKNTNPEVILPVWKDRKIEVNLVVIMDVSDSMRDIVTDMYARMRSITKQISDDIHTTILEVDTDIVNVIREYNLNSRKVKSYYGGGTDLSVGWKYIYDNKMNPDLIICMTDAITPWPEKTDSFFFRDRTVCIIQGDLNNCPYTCYPTEF